MHRLPYSCRKSWTGRLLLLMLPVLLTACFSGQPESAPDKAGKVRPGSVDLSRLAQLSVPDNATYGAVLDDLDRNDLQNIDRALTLFANNKADSLSRDSMLVSFNEFMTSVIQGYYDSKLSGNKTLMEQFTGKDIQPEGQKLVASLASHGIRLTFREGDFYLEPDMAFLSERLNGVLTVACRSYLQTRIDAASGFRQSGEPPLSVPDSLARQVVAWEDFLVSNPGFVLKEEVQSQYIDALSAYLAGTEQAPLFDPATNLTDARYQSSYLQYLEKYPGRGSAGIVKKFYDLLLSKGFKYDEGVDAFLSEADLLPKQEPQ